MRAQLSFPVVFLAACTAPEVLVKGVVYSSYDSTSDRLSQARVIIVDQDDEKYDSVRADAQGKFEARAPEGETIHAEISGEGFEVTSFTGVSGLSEVYRVEDGLLFGFSNAQRAEWEALFAGCPGLETPGGVVFGEIRLLELTDSGEHALVNGVAEVVSRNQKRTWDACYLDDDGLAYAPEATTTGPSGRFAVFGIEPGTRILTVGWEYAPDIWSYSDTYVRLTEDGVAPRFPAWVNWPDM